MFKLLSEFITLEQLSKIVAFSIFLLCVLIIWFFLQNFTHRPVKINDYKTLDTSSLEKYEIYKRKVEENELLLISQNSKIKFAFYCDSLIQSICNNEIINTGNKIVIDHAKIVTINNYKFIQSLKTQNLPKHYAIDYFANHSQLSSNYQQNYKAKTLTLLLIFIAGVGGIFVIFYAWLEEKIMRWLTKFYK